MRRQDRADANVMAWASTIPFSHFFLSAITILEIEQGLLLRDALIAATALVHGMVVVTRNIADFASTGVKTINPWSV
eukprot:gene26228-31515_t